VASRIVSGADALNAPLRHKQSARAGLFFRASERCAQGTKHEEVRVMLGKRGGERDSGLPPQKWDKSSKKADISEVFFVRCGRVVPSSESANVPGGIADVKKSAEHGARNAASHARAHSTGRDSMLKKTWQRSLAMGIFGVVGASLAFVAGARIGSGLDHQTRTVSVAKVQIQQLQQAHQDDAPPAQVAQAH
jgi:hypothetical protein